MVGRRNRVYNLASSPHEPSCRPTFSGLVEPRFSLGLGIDELRLLVAFVKGGPYYQLASCSALSHRMVDATLEFDLPHDFE